MIKSAMVSLRRFVLKSEILSSLMKPVITGIRVAHLYLGSDTVNVEIAGNTAAFSVTTSAELRHFQPVVSEREQIADLLLELDEDYVVYDIGAHVGMYTCFVAQELSNGSVISFEPLPANVESLRGNLDRNYVTAEIHDVALSNEHREVQLRTKKHEPGAIGHLRDNEGKSVLTEQVVGDQYVSENDIPLPTVLKIDVEGAELRVLQGLSKSLSQCRLIYCEVSDDGLQKFGDSEDALLSFLQERGFEITTIGETDIRDHYDLKAVRA